MVSEELPKVSAAKHGNGGLPADVPTLSVGIRWLSFACGLFLLGLLLLAGRLEPSPSGLGTHQQLGLPPCSSILIWGIPCPSCGMTTSWSLALRGELAAAATANFGGLLLIIIAIFYLPASCYFFLTGKVSSGQWFSKLLATCLITAFLTTLLQWVIRIAG